MKYSEFEKMYFTARVHISKGNSKLGNIPSFSLPPVKSCPAACRHTCAVGGCYALKSYRMYPSVRRAWDDNLFFVTCDLQTLKNELDAYFSSMSAPRFFRIHVSGDFITPVYAQLWYDIAAAHPGTKFLAFTKAFNVVRGIPFYKLDNFSLRLSDWPGVTIPDDLRALYRVAWLDDGTRPADTFPSNALYCPGNCETCGACWSAPYDTKFNKH